MKHNPKENHMQFIVSSGWHLQQLSAQLDIEQHIVSACLLASQLIREMKDDTVVRCSKELLI